MVELTLESALSLSAITAIVTWLAAVTALKKEQAKLMKLSIESKITEMDLTKRIHNLMIEIDRITASHLEEIEAIEIENCKLREIIREVKNNDL